MPPQTWLILAGICLAAYLIGSINFAIIVSRVIARDDIRKHGSGNAGMTNMLRTYGKKPAIVTAAGDFAKAFGAVILARYLQGCLGDFTIGADIGYLAGIFAIVGHMFPVYFRFKGGKGVMSALGAMAAADPIVFALVLICSLPLVFITRIISIASISGAIFFMVISCAQAFTFGDNPWYYSICSLVIGIMILVVHRENIKRLHNGTENRLGRKK